MAPTPQTRDRLKALLSQLISLTKSNELHWERQVGSAHRYARLKNNLLILGPATPLADKNVPRYLFITPFDSPACVEVNSDDTEFGEQVTTLVAAVEQASADEPPTDPFSISEEVISRLTE
ncbi:MAG TPA: hypothetical protein VJT50_03240 [Pyrinomonadaceae bacterium]|nr:hypothetical protein [Pyrinomonadaceae bacterium]